MRSGKWRVCAAVIALGVAFGAPNGIKGLPPGALRGFELARLTLGADYRVNSVIGFGPYVDFGLGIYLTRGNELDGPEQELIGLNMHRWLRFGLRATLFP